MKESPGGQRHLMIWHSSCRRDLKNAIKWSAVGGSVVRQRDWRSRGCEVRIQLAPLGTFLYPALPISFGRDIKPLAHIIGSKLHIITLCWNDSWKKYMQFKICDGLLPDLGSTVRSEIEAATATRFYSHSVHTLITEYSHLDIWRCDACISCVFVNHDSWLRLSGWCQLKYYSKVLACIVPMVWQTTFNFLQTYVEDVVIFLTSALFYYKCKYWIRNL